MGSADSSVACLSVLSVWAVPKVVRPMWSVRFLMRVYHVYHSVYRRHSVYILRRGFFVRVCVFVCVCVY